MEARVTAQSGSLLVRGGGGTLTDRAELGRYLQSARMQVGLTVDDLSRRTRIPTRVLRLLEQGDLENLPPPVFVRGFLRSYAREVGIDGEKLVHRFDEALEIIRVEHIPPPVPVGDQASSLDGRRRFAVALFVLILIVIVTITVSLLLQRPLPGRGLTRRDAPAIVHAHTST
jgi:cytoskeletal protein RodZ